MELNKAQEQAVRHTGGPLLIVAGAGTGKTTVITQRIKYLIQEQKAEPQTIVAATFTQKSAEEMLSRLDLIMPLGYQEPWIGTFHRLCDRILRYDGLEIGLNPGFEVLNGADQWMFIKEHLFELGLNYYLPLGNPSKFISALGQFFSRLQDEDVSLEEMEKLVDGKEVAAVEAAEVKEAVRIEELYRAYKNYQALKHQAGVYDFGDLIGLTVKLFRERSNILKRYRRQFKYLHVDEFQDTNYAQFELIKLLAPPKEEPELIVVGDDDQSIYKFRGASVANILEFKEIYLKAKEVVLTENYRSSQEILNASYRMIQNNNPDRLESKLKIIKRLKAVKGNKGKKPVVKWFGKESGEVEWIVQEIARLIQSGLAFRDVAVLARANSQLEPVAAALKRARIPYQLVSNRGLYDQEEVKQLMMLLRVLADPEDSLALFQVLSSGPFNLPPQELYEKLSRSRGQQRTLYQELLEHGSRPAKKALNNLSKYRELSVDYSTVELLARFVTEEGYLKPYIEAESVEHQLKIQNVSLFFEKVKQFEVGAKDRSLLGFLTALEALMEAGDNPGQAQIEDVDTVSLMTVHAAKGLEFEAVFMTNLVAGRFPSINRKDPIEMPEELIKETLPLGDEHIQEERRLFYVGLTRAKSRLYLTAAEDYGGLRKRKLSGFVTETNLAVEEATETEQLSLLNPPKEPVKPLDLKPINSSWQSTSFSQIDTFLTCPLKFKYRYLLRLPGTPSHALAFGETVHKTLHDFHRQKMQGREMEAEVFLNLYRRYFIETGYESAEHKKARFEAGLAAMKRYYREQGKLFGEPVYLEQQFQLKLGGGKKLTGKIDRIDRFEDGYLLVDYKTGQEKSQRQAEKDGQLTIYALAAKEALGISLASLNLHFVETGTTLSTERTEKQLKAAREKLEGQIELMAKSDYPAKPGYPYPCKFCEYRFICPAAAKPS